MYRKIDLAVEQLETAVQLFLDYGSMASVLTLAGAAEEMLGKEAKRSGKPNAIEQLYENQKEVLELLYKQPIKIRNYTDELNYPRNAVKHFNDPEESTFEADLEHAAQWMIVRAYTNYRLLGLPDREIGNQFNEWFYEHVVGA